MWVAIACLLSQRRSCIQVVGKMATVCQKIDNLNATPDRVPNVGVMGRFEMEAAIA